MVWLAQVQRLRPTGLHTCQHSAFAAFNLYITSFIFTWARLEHSLAWSRAQLCFAENMEHDGDDMLLLAYHHYCPALLGMSRYIGSSIRRPEGELAELLPWLADQAADWEAAAAAGAPTTPPLTPDARYVCSLPGCRYAACQAAFERYLLTVPNT